MTTGINIVTHRTDGVKTITEIDLPTLESLQNQPTSVAAAGSTISDGTAVPAMATGGIVLGTASDGTKGILLPSSAGSAPIPIINTVASILKVYPATSTGTINGGSAGAALSVAASAAAIFYPTDSSDNWRTIPKVPS